MPFSLLVESTVYHASFHICIVNVKGLFVIWVGTVRKTMATQSEGIFIKYSIVANNRCFFRLYRL